MTDPAVAVPTEGLPSSLRRGWQTALTVVGLGGVLLLGVAFGGWSFRSTPAPIIELDDGFDELAGFDTPQLPQIDDSLPALMPPLTSEEPLALPPVMSADASVQRASFAAPTADVAETRPAGDSDAPAWLSGTIEAVEPSPAVYENSALLPRTVDRHGQIMLRR